MGLKSPEQELADFLAKHPHWLQQSLRWDFPATPVEASAFAEYGQDRFLKLLEQYEALARRVPEEWHEYRKRRKQIALADIPSGNPGRPRKDMLAEEALELKSCGKSHAQVAIELKRRHPAEKTNAGAVRKLIASRKPRSGPEKMR